MEMAEPIKEQVILRAYELWEQAGRPEGRDIEFYAQAEEQLAEGLDPAPVILPG
jgi:DNA-binding SARP family transcriptional activator